MIPNASHGDATSDETTATRLALVQQSGHQTSGSWRVYEEGVSALFWEAQGLQTNLVTFEVKPLLIEHLCCTALFV
jgi:hypothetical protein